MKALLAQLASVAPTRSVLVIGDLILDEYVFGEARRISAEAPVPVVEFQSRRDVAGGAANVSANLAALGCRAHLIGITGSDDEAKRLQQAITVCGVDAHEVVEDESRPTTVKTRILAQNQQIVRIDREGRHPVAAQIEDAILDKTRALVRHVHAVVISDYGKGVVTPRVARETIAMCSDLNVPVLVDPKSLAIDACRGATVVNPTKQRRSGLRIEQSMMTLASTTWADRSRRNCPGPAY